MLTDSMRSASQGTLAGPAPEHRQSSALLKPHYSDERGRPKKAYRAIAQQELRRLGLSSVPVVVTYFLQFSLGFANFIAIGNLGAKELAATSLSYMMTGVVALAPALGYASAMDTFCSSAFTASADRRLVGVHFQRAVVAVVLHMAAASVVLANMEALMVAAGQDAEVARLCGVYMRLSIPGLVPWALYECTKRFLQAQGIMHASTVVVCVAAPIHWANSYLLIVSPTLGLGYAGAPLNLTLTFWLMFLGIWAYAASVRDVRRAWGGWSRESVRGLAAFYRLGVPAVLTTCGEWWAYESLSLAASYFGPAQLAAQAIILNLVSLSSQIPSAIGYASTPRIGNLLGAARARRARIASHVAIVLAIAVGAATSLAFVLMRAWWGAVYSSDPDVVRCVVDLMPIAGLFLTCNGLNQVFAAVLRAVGRQKLGACIVIPAFNAIGLPLSIYLAYGRPAMEVAGLWWGTCVGTVVSALAQLVFIVYFTDWDKEVSKCLARLIDTSPRPPRRTADAEHAGYGAIA